MSEPNIIVVVDADGNQHWASRQSTFVRDGLADGSLREADERREAGDAAVPAPSADLDAGTTDGGSADGERGPGATDGSADDSVAGATTSRSSRKRG